MIDPWALDAGFPLGSVGNPLILQILLGLLVLFFLFVMYMCAKTWKWFHAVMFFFVFVGSLSLLLVASMSLKTHAVWKKSASDWHKALEKKEGEAAQLTHGDLLEVRPTEPTVETMRGKVNRVMLDRGRVWRGCTPGDLAGGQITLTTPTSPNRIDQNAILYAFKETKVTTADGKEYIVPSVYLGEFLARGVTDNTVSLEPTVPLDRNSVADRERLAHISDKTATWSLYEIMPLDGHHPFSAVESIEQPIDDTDTPIFGDMENVSPNVRDAFVVAVAQSRPNLDADQQSQLVDRLIAAYLRDGQRADEDNDPPDEIWTKVQFVKDHKIIVDSDAATGALEQAYFDSSGRAVVPLLRRGAEAEFAVNDYAVFDRATADDLVSQGVCKEVAPVFVRRLHDYEYAFREIQARWAERGRELALTNRDIQSITEAITRCNQRIASRKEEMRKLELDKAQLTVERDEITKLAETMRQQREELIQELNQLYATNLAMAAKLAEIERRLNEQFEQRATASTSAARVP